MDRQPILFAKWYGVGANQSMIEYVLRVLTLMDEPHRVRVHIRPDLPPLGQGGPVGITQIVVAERRVEPEFLRALAGEFDADANAASSHSLRPPSQAFLAQTHQIAHELNRKALQSWELLSCRLNITGSGSPSPHGGPDMLHWHRGQWNDAFEFYEGWRQIPSDVVKLQMAPSVELDLPDEALRDLSCRFLQADAAPLGHSLLREAERLLWDEVRSPIIVAVAAVESAIKQFVAEIAPDTAWLIDEIPSPPIIRLLNYLVPDLSQRRVPISPPPKHIKVALEKAVELRNRLVHGRKVDVAPAEVYEVIPLLRDILYVLDYARGERWALSHISETTRAAWKGLGEQGGA